MQHLFKLCRKQILSDLRLKMQGFVLAQRLLDHHPLVNLSVHLTVRLLYLSIHPFIYPLFLLLIWLEESKKADCHPLAPAPIHSKSDPSFTT
jgi:hypothetical protein